MIQTALIFAAGRGERLRPLTDRLPKALCLVNGIPLIEYHVTALSQAGFTHIIINHAYLGDQIRRHLKNGAHFGLDITYSPEPPGALETGGAIIQALPQLGNEPFLTISADLFTTFPFHTLRLQLPYMAHLVLAPTSPTIPIGDFGLDAKGRVYLQPPAYTFGNIACFDPQLFHDLPLARLPLGRLLKQWIAQQKVTGELFHGAWHNIGSYTELQAVNHLR